MGGGYVSGVFVFEYFGFGMVEVVKLCVIWFDGLIGVW